jgi:tRNA U55 pseudouridine synthase TruB
MVDLDTLQAIADDEARMLAHLLPVEDGLVDFPTVEIGADAARRLLHGQAVDLDPHATATGDGLVAARCEGGPLLGLARREAGRLVPQRLFRTDAPTV